MRLVVVGDALLDVDLTGSADRLCPDAPVPVVDVAERRRRPGGAALAALLAAGRGAAVTLVAGSGDDAAGRELRGLVAGFARFVAAPFRGATPVKARVRAGGQSLLRLDTGDGRVSDVDFDVEVSRVLRGADAVLVADYGRGATAAGWLRRELSELPPGIPLVWDPHPRGAAPVARADLVVPNRAEARGLTGFADPGSAAQRLHRRWRCGAVAVTLGADGAAVFPPGEGVSAPQVPPGADPCGAGDAFSAAAAAALHHGLSAVDAVRRAAVEASRFVAGGGAGAWTVGEVPRADRPVFDVVARVRAAGGRVVAAGGCFDLLHPGHVRLLRRARELGDFLVVCLNSDESVRRLKGPLRPVVPERDRRAVLEALECVDAVAVFDETTPCALLERLRPQVWVKGSDHDADDLPEARVVERYGGRVATVPRVDGYSTTGLLDTVQPTA
ncbi:PfkB family carbohydrate kinase [Saccharopolyspora rosea]|uniref:PfkB family carbohydrate kinase n=1 Tax=Saccharopolyspora rosea TaxID=524884 RepID=A0ABW3FZ57_9PSEU